MKKNNVKYLQRTRFSQLALAETTEIKNLICLTPDLVISPSPLNRIQTDVRKFIPAICDKHEARSGAFGWGCALQVGRSQVRFLMVSLNFLLTSSRPRYGTGFDSASNTNEYQEYFLAGKGGRCLRLKTVPPSYIDYLETWEPYLPETLRFCPGLYMDCFTYTLTYTFYICKAQLV